jgi:hypothetical protein
MPGIYDVPFCTQVGAGKGTQKAQTGTQKAQKPAL